MLPFRILLNNSLSETTEITEVGPHAMRKRTLKSKRKKGKASNANPKLYHGARGRYHYFLCLQLILRKQIAALTKIWELPPEFEIICRDVWALNLALLPDPPPAEPYHHAVETQIHDEVDPVVDIKAFSSSMKQDLDGASEDEQANDDDANEKEEHSDTDEDEEEEEDAELELLMQENSDLSSSSEDELGESKISGPESGQPKMEGGRKGRFRYESPLSTIAVLVVTCWMMRIPVMYRDFTRLIEKYEIPYLNGVKSLPESMTEHLTKHNVQALSPPHAPRTMAMHKVASRLAKKLNSNYGIYVPEINAASILWRITKEMGGTPLLYRLAKRVASVLSVPLTLHWTLAPGLAKLKPSDAFRHHYDGVPPEASLLGALIIVIKMVYGLDGTTRGPEDGDIDDVACLLGSEEEFLKQINKLTKDEQREMKFDSRRQLNVGDMTDEEMDEYIAFCAKAVGYGESDSVVERFFGPVSVGRSGGETGGHWLAEDEGAGTGIGAAAAAGGSSGNEGCRRAEYGAEYKIWNSRDVDGAVPAGYEAVMRRGETLVGMNIGGMLAAFERRLVRTAKRL
ncbi:hypothetical protein JR316_0004830 [Psilocybe cubensis]|uniref:Uncharacterized protein n=2 Tax=Psilocybe cubensis TaxID=181762 RepID=A0ACB8H4T9_PSICU|nr:hypothetical protein JR316_0004830 [Psilocybe cubensis]KAH9482730.1 hypothetical protein JR316_0004830 [Psilocybe cubensis]